MVAGGEMVMARRIVAKIVDGKFSIVDEGRKVETMVKEKIIIMIE